MGLKKFAVATAVSLALGASSVSAGVTPPPPSSSSDNNHEILIGAVVLGLAIWLFSRGSASPSSISTKNGPSDSADTVTKGRVLQQF